MNILSVCNKANHKAQAITRLKGTRPIATRARQVLLDSRTSRGQDTNNKQIGHVRPQTARLPPAEYCTKLISFDNFLHGNILVLAVGACCW